MSHTSSATSCPTSPSYAVSNSYDGLLRQDNFDGTSLPSGWASSASGVSVSGGNLVITGAGNWNVYASRSETRGDRTSVRVIFKVSGALQRLASGVGNVFMSHGTSGQSSYRRWGLRWTGGTLARVSYTGTNSQTANLLTLKAETWYEGVLILDSTDQFRAVVWERDNGQAALALAVWAQNSVTHSDWNTQAWSFTSQSNTWVA